MRTKKIAYEDCAAACAIGGGIGGGAGAGEGEAEGVDIGDTAIDEVWTTSGFIASPSFVSVRSSSSGIRASLIGRSKAIEEQSCSLLLRPLLLSKPFMYTWRDRRGCVPEKCCR
jgi:hypothetical protein